MRICIDTRVLCQSMTGIGRYTLNLVNALAQVDSEGNEYFLAFEGNVPEILPFGQNFTPVFIKKRIPLPFFGSQINLPYLLWKSKIDVFHCPQNWQFPFLKPCRYVVTVHDLFPFLTPWKVKSVKDSLYHKFYLASISSIPKKADAVIVDSQHSKNEVIHWLRVPSDKIIVIPMAVDKVFQRPLNAHAITDMRGKYGIHDPFILHVGADERKNSFAVIRAYRKVCSFSTNLNYKLVIVGRLDRQYSEMQDLVKEMDLAGRVVFTGTVTDEDLVMLYHSAELLVYPCLQGPGLPPLEAMTCGTPVIASKSPPLLEMAGDAALLVDPKNEDDIAEGIVTLLSDNSLKEELRQRGLERAKMFSWERVAQETLNTYRKVYEIG